jgi:transcriptional regulator with XRE-family HTH domain
MWIDRVKEAKQKLGLSYQEIASRTSGKLSQRDVMRMIKGDYKKPFVDDVIELGAALKLSPKDLFEEANLVVESTAAAQESSKISNENEKLLAEIEKLNTVIEHQKELLTAKDELIEVYKKLTKDM